MTSKADYVRSQPQTRDHGCHWPGCDKQVPPALWGCKAHWFSLPVALRNRIWATYQRGQEVTMTPSTDYIEAANAVQKWIAEFQAQNRGQSIAARERGGSPHGKKATGATP